MPVLISSPFGSQPPAFAGPASRPVVPSRPQPAAASQVPVPRPPAPRPIIRAQSEDPAPVARPAPLVLPSPEELGVGRIRPSAGADADWSAAYRRLHDLGAVCFQLEKLDQGGCRCTCLLPTTHPDRRHRVETRGTSEAAAVRLALERVEQWSGQRQ